jgi:hypothetical protein
MTKNFRKLPKKRSSEIFKELADSQNMEKSLTIKHIIQALGERAFGILILFFSLPCLLPVAAIPGIAVLVSLPIAIFALEMIFGRKSVWLPNKIAHTEISQEKISQIIRAVLPYIIKFEHIAKPRWSIMTNRAADILNGIVILSLAFLLMLPIPFSNFIFGIILVIFSIGIIEEDGILIIIGYILYIIYLFFISVLVIKAIETFFYFQNYF